MPQPSLVQQFNQDNKQSISRILCRDCINDRSVNVVYFPAASRSLVGCWLLLLLSGCRLAYAIYSRTSFGQQKQQQATAMADSCALVVECAAIARRRQMLKARAHPVQPTTLSRIKSRTSIWPLCASSLLGLCVPSHFCCDFTLRLAVSRFDIY